MAKPVVTLRDGVIVDKTQDELFALLSDPVALITALEAEGVSIRKMPATERWVLGYPARLGERVVDLRCTESREPVKLTWLSQFRGYNIETGLKLEDAERGGTRLRLVSKVYAKSLRAKLTAPILKLGEKRLRKGVRKGLVSLADKLARD